MSRNSRTIPCFFCFLFTGPVNHRQQAQIQLGACSSGCDWLVDVDALRQGIVLLQHSDGLVDLGLQGLLRLQQQQQLAVVHLQQHAGDLAGQLRLQALHQGEQALAQHLLLLLRGGGCQHGSGQVATLLAGHDGGRRGERLGLRRLRRRRGRGGVVGAVGDGVGAAAGATAAVHGAGAAPAAAALGAAVHGAVHARAARAAAARVRAAPGAHHDDALGAVRAGARAEAAAGAARAALRATGEGRHVLVHGTLRAAVGALGAAALLGPGAVGVGGRRKVLVREGDGVGREHAGHGHCAGSTGAAGQRGNALLGVLLLQLLAANLPALGQGHVPGTNKQLGSAKYVDWDCHQDYTVACNGLLACNNSLVLSGDMRCSFDCQRKGHCQ